MLRNGFFAYSIFAVNEGLKIILTELKRNSHDEFLFCNRDGSPIESINRTFQTALRRSGIAQIVRSIAYGTYSLREQ